MMGAVRVAVTATSFCKFPDLIAHAKSRFPKVDFQFCDPQTSWNSQKLLEFLEGAHVWLVGKELVDSDLLCRLPSLGMIGKYGVGIDNIDFDACKAHGVKVHWEPGVNSQEVAELTIGLMISICRNIGLSSRKLHSGIWWKNGGENFSGKKIGIVGLGHIGSKVAALCKAFQCEVYVHDIRDLNSECRYNGYHWEPNFLTLIPKVDILSFHVPLTSKTCKMLSGKALDLLAPHSVVVNTSRGEVLDQKKLTDMASTQRIKGLALDVFESEPLVDKNLYSLDNFLGTAHIAGNSRQAVWKMAEAALRGIDKFLLDR